MNWQDVLMNILFCFQVVGNNNGEQSHTDA